MQDGIANRDALSEQREQIDAERLDVRPHRARRNGLEAERNRVFGDFFTGNQADVPSAWLAGGTAESRKVTIVAHESFAGHEFNRIHRLQWRARFRRMQMQGSDTTV